MEGVSRVIIQRLKTMVENTGMHGTLCSNYESVSTLLPYAIRLEQCGQQEMIDAIIFTAKILGTIFRWHRIGAQVASLFDESSPSSLDRVITLISPHVPWYDWGKYTRISVARWAVAVSAVPHSEEVDQSVVNALLQIASQLPLRRHIPVNVWAWLKKRPLLHPVCQGRSGGSSGSVVRHVRGLRDIEILKSYLLLVWSEWDGLDPDGCLEMQALIREDFGGVGMWCHRDDLIEHLDIIQEQLDRGVEYFQQHRPWILEHHIQQTKEQYEGLKNILVDVDKTVMKTLTRTPPR